MAALMMAVAACGDDSTGVSGDCVVVYWVLAEGQLYEWDDAVVTPTGAFPAEPYATVLGIGDACQDLIVDGVPANPGLQEGESTFLPAGTELYPVDGFEPTARLVTVHDGERIVLVAVEE